MEILHGNNCVGLAKVGCKLMVYIMKNILSFELCSLKLDKLLIIIIGSFLFL